MENKDIDTFDRLLMMEEPEPEPISEHTEENILPPVGLARPELIDLFQENIGNEEKIKQGIKEVEDYLQENPLQTVEREAKSYGLRALEGLGGTIGGLLNLLSGEAYFNDQGELSETKVPMLPSASELREFTKEKTGKKFEPKTKFSKEAHEAVTDIGASLPLPGGWFQKLMMPIFGQSAKALAVNQGATEKQGDLIKLGFMTGATIANIGNAPRAARQAYHEVTQAIPQGTRLSTRSIQNGLNTIENRPWYRTGRTTSKGPAMDEVDRINRSIQHGSMDAHDAMQIRRDINEARKKLGAFHYEPGMDKAAARRYLDEVDEVMREGLENFGNRQFPGWYQQYERANQAYGVTQRSMQLQDYIANNAITHPLQSQLAKTVFNLGGASAIMHAPALLTAAIPVAAGAKGMQILNRMFRSPVLRNHYLEVLAAASAQNAGAMNRALIKFDKEAQKLEKKSQ